MFTKSEHDIGANMTEQSNADESHRYVKPSQKRPPRKSDHRHEYVRVVTWMHVQYWGGRVSQDKKKFRLPPVCMECGAVRRKYTPDAVEVEVTPAEFREERSKR